MDYGVGYVLLPLVLGPSESVRDAFAMFAARSLLSVASFFKASGFGSCALSLQRTVAALYSTTRALR